MFSGKEKTTAPDASHRSIADNMANVQQTLPAVPALQRVEEEELKKPALLKSVVQKKDNDTATTPNNTGMPDNLKAGIENLSGMTMDDVQVHYNSDKPAQLSALAYAQGNDIHIGPGQEKHLPHEAWHVVQQRQGRVQATTQLKEGIPVNDDASLESEADAKGAEAAQA
jgi:hypothetical protein